jgi:1-pyrroline-5-carboxylate dehydrogenase
VTQKHYAKGSLDRVELEAAVEALKRKSPLDVPLVVDGREVGYTSPLASRKNG